VHFLLVACGKDGKFRGKSSLRVLVVEGQKISLFLCRVTFTILAYVISKSFFAN